MVLVRIFDTGQGERVGSNGFESVVGRKKAATTMLVIMTVIAGVNIYHNVDLSGFLDRAAAGLVTDPNEGTRLDERAGLFAIAELLGLIVSAVFFVRWMHRAYLNLDIISDVPKEFTGGQVGWAFFIPFINLVRPYQVVAELWKKSLQQDGAPLVGLWWFLWIGGNIWSNFLSRATPETIPDLKNHVNALIANEVLSAVCAILIIKVLSEITSAQERRATIAVAETFV